MARKALIVRKTRYSVRRRNRCSQCFRPRSFFRTLAMCRICARRNISVGNIPGWAKISW